MTTGNLGIVAWVIDDDATVLLLAEDLLFAEGYQVRTFGDAGAALDALDAELPNIVLLDVMIPGMDGFQFCSRIRRHPGGEDIPVLMMTSLDDPASIDKAYECGATDFAIKPLNWAIEIHRVRYMLRSASVAKQLRQKELEARQAQKMEAVGTLAGGIAHEFNNLLQIISGAAHLLAPEEKADSQENWELQSIVDATKRGSALTHQLLTFSRRSASWSKKVITSLNQQVLVVQKMLERTLPKNIIIHTEFALDLFSIHADQGQMQQVLINLIVNASHAMPGGGTITIQTRNVQFDRGNRPAIPELQPGEHVLLAVLDTGCGMNQETLDRIYEPFFTTKGVGQGTGLGLSVVFGIVKEHAGVIHCESQPGRGTTFSLYFPAYKESMPGETPAAEIDQIVQRGTETIMIVDDEDMVRRALHRALTRSGYTVISLADGESALRHYQAEKKAPDLVILDLGMPGMDGWTCLRRLRELDPHVKVLIASGYGGDDLERKLMELGANGFVMKPYLPSVLTGYVRNIIVSPVGTFVGTAMR